MKGIDAYRARFPGTFRWPDGQNTHVDQYEDDVRQQFKTARKERGSIRMNLRTRNGRYDGKQISVPYPSDAFDELVVVYFHTGVHFWKIPAHVLVEHGVLATDDQPGKTKITVVPPTDVDIGFVSSASKYDWTREYYVCSSSHVSKASTSRSISSPSSSEATNTMLP